MKLSQWIVLVTGLALGGINPTLVWGDEKKMEDWKSKPESYWKEKLTPEQYKICRQKGTERAFTGKYWDNHAKGIYRCAACGQELFSSETKFESGTGWPSYYDIIKTGNVEVKEDNSWFMKRTEVVCGRCGSHLGHVFDDGPKPTNKRYCINSACLEFVPAAGETPTPSPSPSPSK